MVYTKKIVNKYIGFLEPIYVPKEDYIYVIINDVSAVRVIKTDLNLNFVWGQTLNFADDRIAQGKPTFFRLNDVVETDNGDVIFVGYAGEGYAQELGLVIKLTSNGELSWCKENTPIGKFTRIEKWSASSYLIIDNFALGPTVHYSTFNIDANGEVMDSFYIRYRNNSDIRAISIKKDFLVLVSASRNFIKEEGIYRVGIQVSYKHPTKNINEQRLLTLPENKDLNVDSLAVHVKDNILNIYGVDGTNNAIINIVANLDDLSAVATMDVFSIGDSAGADLLIYSSEENSEAYYAYHRNTPSTTIVYKFEPQKGLIWTKEISKNIREIISSDKKIFAHFLNEAGDNSVSLSKISLDFDAGKCFNSNTLNNLVPVANEIENLLLEPVINTPRKYPITDTALTLTPITDYEVEDICIDNDIPNIENGTITATPSSIEADGRSTSVIEVVLKDDDSVILSNSAASVVIQTTKGSITATSLNTNGNFTAKLTATNTHELAKLSFTINGELATKKAWVRFKGEKEELPKCEHSFARKIPQIHNILRSKTHNKYLYVLTSERLFKVDEKGEVIWASENHSKSNPYHSVFSDFDVTSTGDLILLGTIIEEPSSQIEVIALKLNSEGEKIFTKRYQNLRFSLSFEGFYIKNIGRDEFIISLGAHELLKINTKGELLKAIRYDFLPGDDSANQTTTSSEDFIAILERDQSLGTFIYVFDTDLDLVNAFELDIDVEHISIIGDELFASKPSGFFTQSELGTFLKIRILEFNKRSVSAKEYPKLSSMSNFYYTSHKERLNANSRYLYVFQKQLGFSEFPILHKLDLDFNIIWSKELVHYLPENEYVDENISGQITGFNVNGDCLTFSLETIYDEAFVSSEWLIHTNGDLEINPGNCLKIKAINSPNASIREYVVTPIEYSVFDGKVTEEPITIEVLNSLPTSLKSGPICPRPEKIKYTQSPVVRLEAAGSTGKDGSAKGVHLRWAFANYLGENHLPKGNLATANSAFNKENDFVKISKIPYEKIQISLNLSEPPLYYSRVSVFRSTSPIWVYSVEGNYYYLVFRNANQYYNTLRTINPNSNALDFLERYGSNILEIRTAFSLAFSVEFIVQNSAPQSRLLTELISSEDQSIVKKQEVVARKTFVANEFSDTYQQVADIKKVRYSAQNCIVSEVKFELYATIVDKANKEELWQDVGEYALSTDKDTVFSNLEPVLGLIDGKWPRFNEGDLVNIENYKQKWDNDKKDAFDKDIKQIVEDYIRLGNDVTNPKGIEEISFGDDDNESIEVAYVDMLNIVAQDFHVARMLGLGCLDLDEETSSQKFMYAVRYTTKNKLQNYRYSDSDYEVEHIYTSLPTSVEEQRLPLAWNIEEIAPGIPTRESNGATEEGANSRAFLKLAKEDGYSQSGKSRYVSLYAEALEEDTDGVALPKFYEFDKQFNSSKYTEPVGGGLEVKRSEEAGWNPGNSPWDKPELSIDTEYRNKVTVGEPTFEILPLGIPEKNNPLFVHNQTQEGFYVYGIYGINIFGRATPVSKTLEIETKFVPDNKLLPPHNVTATHIVEERPLMLTSASEQELLLEIPESKPDKTLIRLTFDYNSIQELISYKITDQLLLEAQDKLKDKLKPGENVLLHPEAIFKDDKEIFADEIQLFFRNQLPNNIQGKITRITEHPTDPLLAIIETGNYRVESQTTPDSVEEDVEYLIPRLPEGTSAENFKGGVFTTNGTNFFVQNINTTSSGVQIVVYKKQTTDSVQTAIIPDENVPLELPIIQGDALFMAVENMASASSWNGPNPNSRLAIEINTGDNSEIHREEIILKEGSDDKEERILEKTRGFWGEATITRVEEPIGSIEEIVNGQSQQTIIRGHKGVYKIDFPFKLNNHPQQLPDSVGNFVQWHGGIVRIHTQSDATGPRKTLKVIRIENTGSATENVTVYALDEAFQVGFDSNAKGARVPKVIPPEAIILEGSAVETNFYPGYKVYLYADPSFNLTHNTITPQEEDLKYSIFGLRSKDFDAERVYGKPYESLVSSPALMFVHKITEPLQPEKPKGALYATQPDSFGKATYTLTTAYKHKPYATMFYRSNDRSILGALYTNTTVAQIIQKLESFDPDVFYANRWEDLLSFNYQNYSNSFDVPNTFSIWPKSKTGFRFPKPDKPSFFEIINSDINDYNKKYNENQEFVDSNNFDLSTLVIPKISNDLPEKTVSDYVKEAILISFVPLTEVPLIYDHIRGENYQPIAKKQVIRNRNGNLLRPTERPYDNAPMAKRIPVSGQLANDVLFTDFFLDGTSKNTYFYTAREVGSTSQLGPFSTVIGPIKLVNTREPEAPQIKRILPILANREFEMTKVPLEFLDVENIQIIEENTLVKTSSSSNWDAGVASKQILRGNSYVTFKANEGASAVIGFSSYNTNSHFETIQFGLHLKSDGRLEILESGENLGEVGTYTEDSIFRIEIKGNRILYSRDEVLLYEAFLLKATDYVLDISLNSGVTQISNITLYTKATYYSKEIFVGTVIPLTYFESGIENVEIKDGVISKISGISTEAWDSGAYSNEYAPYYSTLTYKVLRESNIVVGFSVLENQDSTEKIAYALRTSEDGYLYVYKNGNELLEKCVRYDETSLLEIERRNTILIFKKNGRPFYELVLDSNIPLLVDFSMYTNDSQIIDLQLKSTEEVIKNSNETEINPTLQFEVNAYQKDQRIRRLNLYRTQRPENSLSVRTMDLVSSVDLVITGQLDKNILTITDEFLDLDFIPYSEALYYRVTVSREVEYEKPKLVESEASILVSEYKPSKASRVMISSIVESVSPVTSNLTYSFDALPNNDEVIDNIILRWDKTVHNGKYHIYSMNTQGNWIKIHELTSNDEEIQLFLSETDLEGLLQIKDTDGDLKYHHFKVDAENSVGMLNIKSQILTIPSQSGVAALEGIGSMIIENTNLVR